MTTADRKETAMTDLRIDYQLLDEVRVSLGRLAAEFVATQRNWEAALSAPKVASAMN
jgi:hypothetical protein